jgi:hypothetical protein
VWPSGLEFRLAQVAREGQRLSTEEYRRHWQFYFEPTKAGSSGMGLEMIEDGFLYRGVRICHVDPQRPKTRCTEAYVTKQ